MYIKVVFRNKAGFYMDLQDCFKSELLLRCCQTVPDENQWSFNSCYEERER